MFSSRTMEYTTTKEEIVYEIQEDSIIVYEVYNQYRKFIRTYRRK